MMPSRRCIAAHGTHRQTASILAIPHGLTPIQRDGLREIDHGHWEGLRRADVETQFPVEYAAWNEDPFAFAPEGGEAGVNVIARALPVIREIVLQHRGKMCWWFRIKPPCDCSLAACWGLTRGYRDRLDQSPACLNILDFKDPVRARLMLFNDVSHYVDHAPVQ